MIRRLTVIGLAAWMGLGCGADLSPTGTLEFALHDGTGGWFRLALYETAADVEGGEALYDSGCLEVASRTYDVSNVPVGHDRVVLFEGFTSADCADNRRVEMGYRGDISIQQGDRPYYHIPIYVDRGMSAFPEALNLSESSAVSLDFCDADADCADTGLTAPICYDQDAPDYWCVPTCLADADCTSLHPRATCDAARGWCTLNSPFPLNLSEPRALGEAVTLANGDVAFIGGFGTDGQQGLLRTNHLVEVFDQSTGIFRGVDAEGVTNWPAGFFGFAALGEDRYLMAGGVDLAALSWNEEGKRLDIDVAWDTAVSDALIVVDPTRGVAVRSALPRAVAMPTIVSLGGGKVLIAGGITGGATEPTIGKDAWLCDVGSDLTVACEGTSPLTTARAGAAGRCLDPGCDQVLVLGGVTAGAVADIYDRSGDSPAFVSTAIDGLESPVWFPRLCDMTLASWSRGFGAAHAGPMHKLTLIDDELTATPVPVVVSPAFGAVTGSDALGCYVGGGLVEGIGASTVVVGPGAEGVVLSQARFGAAAARIGAGPLAGKVLFGGGLTVDDAGRVEFVRGVEVLSP